MSTPTKWLTAWNEVLGNAPDPALAAELGVSPTCVRHHRIALGIAAFKGKRKTRCTRCGRPVSRTLVKENVRCRRCHKIAERERVKAYYAENKAVCLEKLAAYQAAHPEKMRVWRARYREKNRYQIRATDRRRRQEDRDLLAGLPCLSCGMFHDAETRQRVAARMLPATAKEIREAWPCFWGPPWEACGAAARLLYRDLRAIGAVGDGGTFDLPREAAAA